MLYKLYIQTFKEGQQPDYAIVRDLVRIYRDNDVTVLGHFINKIKPNVTILITIYKDEAHYQQFVEKMRRDPKYQQRREYLESIRESIVTMDMVLNEHSFLHPNELDLTDYVTDVKSLTDTFDTEL